MKYILATLLVLAFPLMVKCQNKMLPASFKKIDEKTYIGLQKELNLFGATQVKINGVLTAIVLIAKF